MRDIKFRHFDGKYMQYSREFLSLADYFNFFKEFKKDELQYTGLKDENGIEIYEGDIVKGNYLRGVGTIKWSDKFCRFQIDDRATITPSDAFEVIGNIYENKD